MRIAAYNIDCQRNVVRSMVLRNQSVREKRRVKLKLGSEFFVG